VEEECALASASPEEEEEELGFSLLAFCCCCTGDLLRGEGDRRRVSSFSEDGIGYGGCLFA